MRHTALVTTCALLLAACGGNKPPEAAATEAARLDWPAACPSPGDPAVHYQHATWAERDVCMRIRFTCGETQTPIESPSGTECGCGCVDKPAQ